MTVSQIQERLEVKLGRAPSQEELVKALTAEVTKLESRAKAGDLTLNVSEKGAVSVYGLMRFPVTLYGNQWEKLAEAMPAIMDFIEANKGSLAVKEPKAAA